MEFQKYIITGGPGSGKSTLVAGLEEQGYACSAEISRKMIQAEVARGSDCLPWKDIACFSDKVILEMAKAWQQASANSLTFFDRGIPDVIAYLHIAKLPVPVNYLDSLAQHPYAQKVFILPPWEGIYINDNERWQSFEEASLIYTAIRDTYSGFGFELIEVPKVSLQERIAFVLKAVFL
ncbi:AAA family ATPase [Pedobacter sp. L105]|uniref:AAA family ATPase n=1 Tax=Pedobacter sp. L105 TaxID=1641871 RepID=UPI00131DC2D1|nr:AAA family ATPase [Pedobacter sp. L105]